MSILSCINNQGNIGRSSCKKLPQLIKGIITTPEDFSLSFEQAATTTAWQAALLATKSNRIYLWPYAVAVEQVNEDAVYEETQLSTLAVRDGRYRFRMSFRENLQLHKAIFTHKNFEGRIFLIDNQNRIIGTELDDGSFAGFSIDLLNPEKLMFNDGSVTSKTPVYISLEDNLELDQSGAMIEGGTVLKALIPLTSVDLTVISASATLIVASVKSALDLVPVLGLDVADFILLDASGNAQTISGITDNDDGTYDLAGTAFVSGTLNLVAASALSVPGFESSGSADVTI